MKKSLLDIFRKIENREPLTAAEKAEYIYYSISHHKGKMEGIYSISTSCLCNSRCEKRMKNKNFICSSCYAAAQLEYRTNNQPKLKHNTEFYSYYELTKECIPIITSRIFRFESFGDITNILHFRNYCTLASAKHNRHCTFALWTKNPDIIAAALNEGVKIPKNMIIVYSIPKKNWIPTKEQIKNIKRKYPFIDKIFVVVTKDFQKEHNITINCQKKCLPCLKCYTKQDKTQLIIELEK